MNLKFWPLAGALAVSSPAFGITVNMTDFSFASPRGVEIVDTDPATPTTTLAGRFFGEAADEFAIASAGRFSNAVAAASSTSFTAWCAELSQSFLFDTDYDYTRGSGIGYFGAAKYDSLSRLFTATAGFVVDSDTSAAVQAGIWEIIYETDPGFDLNADGFKAAPPAGAGAATFAAFASVNTILGGLSSYAALYSIDVLVNGSAQDFLVATPIPEPSIWALLVGGLGVLGWVARRRKA